jgi:hypothetical protein
MANNRIPIPPPNWVLRRIDNYLECNFRTGTLIWLISNNSVKFGNIAGSINKQGYIAITFSNHGEKYTVKAHHVIWYKYYGKWPDDELDHKNTIRHDNRIKNLRKSKGKNPRNHNIYKNNTSGITGISWDKNKNLWIVRIDKNKKAIFLGGFKSLVKAKMVRRKAEKKYFGKWRFRS